MGLFSNGKDKEDLNELVVKTTNNVNEIIAVRRDVENTKNDVKLNRIETDKQIKGILDKVSILENIILSYKNEIASHERIAKEELLIESNKEDNLTFNDVCKTLKIKNLKSSLLKFYLHEKGLLNMTINADRNSFAINNENLNYIDKELLECLIVDNDKILFDKSFIDYAEKYRCDIVDSIERYINKQEQYKISKKSLESRNTKNYKEEIGKICGIKDNYDGSKWGNIYKTFSQRFTTFQNDYNKYIEENNEEKYPMTKIKYVVSVMGEGNYLLKIACDLYA